MSCHCGNVDGIGGVVRWGGDCFMIFGRRDEGVPCRCGNVCVSCHCGNGGVPCRCGNVDGIGGVRVVAMEGWVVM